MRFVRMIMALVIALSVAMLPAVGTAASVVKSTSQAATEAMADDMSGVMDCCPDDAKTKLCDHPSGRCPMAFCAVQSLNLALAGVFRFEVPSVEGNPLPIPTDQVVALHDSSPPFRPPRV